MLFLSPSVATSPTPASPPHHRYPLQQNPSSLLPNLFLLAQLQPPEDGLPGRPEFPRSRFRFPLSLSWDVPPPRRFSLFNPTSLDIQLQQFNVICLHFLIDFDLVIFVPFGSLNAKRIFPLHKKLILVSGKRRKYFISYQKNVFSPFDCTTFCFLLDSFFVRLVPT